MEENNKELVPETQEENTTTVDQSPEISKDIDTAKRHSGASAKSDKSKRRSRSSSKKHQSSSSNRKKSSASKASASSKRKSKESKKSKDAKVAASTDELDAQVESSNEEKPTETSTKKEEVTAAVEEKKVTPVVKKKFVAKVNVMKCTFCTKTVYPTEVARDAKERLFHKLCLRCSTCRKDLTGKQPVFDSKGGKDSNTISASQYRVVVPDENSNDNNSNSSKLYCNLHATIVQGTKVQGQEASKKAKNEEELRIVQSIVAESNQDIKESMEIMMGDMTPVCGRCGGNLKDTENMAVSGMERFHKLCPSKEELEKENVTVRNVVGKLPDRLAVQLFENQPEEAAPKTILLVLDKDTKKAALSQKKHQASRIVFVPDDKANMAREKKLSPGTKLTDLSFQAKELGIFALEPPAPFEQQKSLFNNSLLGENILMSSKVQAYKIEESLLGEIHLKQQKEKEEEEAQLQQAKLEREQATAAATTEDETQNNTVAGQLASDDKKSNKKLTKKQSKATAKKSKAVDKTKTSTTAVATTPPVTTPLTKSKKNPKKAKVSLPKVYHASLVFHSPVLKLTTCTVGGDEQQEQVLEVPLRKAYMAHIAQDKLNTVYISKVAEDDLVLIQGKSAMSSGDEGGKSRSESVSTSKSNSTMAVRSRKATALSFSSFPDPPLVELSCENHLMATAWVRRLNTAIRQIEFAKHLDSPRQYGILAEFRLDRGVLQTMEAYCSFSSRQPLLHFQVEYVEVTLEEYNSYLRTNLEEDTTKKEDPLKALKERLRSKSMAEAEEKAAAALAAEKALNKVAEETPKKKKGKCVIQ